MATNMDAVVDSIAKEIQDYMKNIIKREVYDVPPTTCYARTGDLLNSVRFEIKSTGDGYKVQIGFDKSLIRPKVSSNPDMYNHHMTGKGNDPHPRDVSDKLPKWYDKGFVRNGKLIKTNVVDRTKEAFPIEVIRSRVIEAILSDLKLK